MMYWEMLLLFSSDESNSGQQKWGQMMNILFSSSDNHHLLYLSAIFVLNFNYYYTTILDYHRGSLSSSAPHLALQQPTSIEYNYEALLSVQ